MNKEAKETLDLDKEEVIQNEQVNTETDAENTPQGEAEMYIRLISNAFKQRHTLFSE